MTSQTARRTLRLGHSPDPDDAFMWYALASAGGDGQYQPRIDTGGYEFVHVLEDIQSLNDRAEQGELEITAVSIHQYPYIAKDYQLTHCGASMGDEYGPMVVVREGSGVASIEDLLKPGCRVAVPGLRTSAYLALGLILGEKVGGGAIHGLNKQVVPFDQIIPAVAGGQFDAGLIIHEGQLTYEKSGLKCLADLGSWWTQSRGVPLPLGGNAIRRDLGQPAMGEICGILLRAIQYALDHRDEAVDYALNYARDMGRDLAKKFVGMYVNHWTLDYGPAGRRAIERFLKEGAAAGLVPALGGDGSVDFVYPGGGETKGR